MALAIFLIVVGCVLLYYGADFVVGGSCNIARRLGIPSIIVGLTVVSFGTSLPEGFVSIVAALMGNPCISVSNVIGSNIINIGLVLGCSACFYPLLIDKKLLKSEVPFMIGVSLLLMLFCMDKQITRIEGGILCACLIWFNHRMIANAKKDKTTVSVEDKAINIPKSIFLMLAGFVALTIGASLLVNNASYIARIIGVPEWLIGLTIVALGTSLPELATSVIAAIKKESDISVGNIVGSNIFNILFVIGISSLIAPLSLAESSHIMIDLILMLAFSIGILPLMYRSLKLGRKEGILLLIGYVAFTAYVIIRR